MVVVGSTGDVQSLDFAPLTSVNGTKFSPPCYNSRRVLAIPRIKPEDKSETRRPAPSKLDDVEVQLYFALHVNLQEKFASEIAGSNTVPYDWPQPPKGPRPSDPMADERIARPVSRAGIGSGLIL